MKGPRLVAPLAMALLGIALSLPAVANSEVNVYSYRQPFLIKPMLNAFTRETGIEVNVVYAEKGLVERLKQEGANSPADLVFTVDVGRLTDVHDAGLTRPIESSVVSERIPAQYHGPDRHYVGLTSRARIVVASKDRAGDITSIDYEDLAKPEFKGRVCTRSGKHVYMVALIASMIAHHGEVEAEKWLRGLKANLARKPQSNDRGQVKAIKEGVCDLAIINHYYLAQMYKDEEQTQWVEAVNVLFPNQANRGTHVNVSGVALTASAPNRENAIKLIEYLTGDLAQQMYAELNTEYPLKPGVPVPGFLQSLGEFKRDDLALARIAAQRGAASKLVDIVDYDN